ncbi:hypothetical protein THAOC_08865 [Thalassiosira oceanica]|uniref:Uncharacterized protein n=1 Tax=Thalassiosira oceanica TaxID=159749 RepID=K0SXZ2_THAOC|nr:hypothetical protein THAOC_08865 [Thalassiosira oceanica]|eukprot:EJK69839.1 hypothetical protein THAOC_08865 [Thalassiosira oceanica]
MVQTPYSTNDRGDGEMMPDDDSDDDVTYAPNDDEDDCDIEDEDWEADDEEQNKALDPSVQAPPQQIDGSYKELYKVTPFPLFSSSSSFPSSITAAAAAWTRNTLTQSNTDGHTTNGHTQQMDTQRMVDTGLFFLSAPLAITSYHTNKTRLAEAPFGPVGDDNGPGSEPPPHDCLRYV